MRCPVMDNPPLKLAEFLPDRLLVLAEAVAQPLARLCSEQYGLTIAEWRILAVLNESGQLTSAAISHAASMHKVKVSRAIAGLEGKGLIERTANREDMRETFVALTDKGLEIYREVASQAQEFSLKLTARLSKSDMNALWRIIDVLNESAGGDIG